VLAEGVLGEKSNVQNLHIANSDKPVKFYNLDVIISVSRNINKKPCNYTGLFILLRVASFD